MIYKAHFLTVLLSAAAGLTAQAQTEITLTVTTEQRQTVTGFGAAALEHLMRPIDEVSIIRKAYEPDSPIGLNIMRMEMSPNTKGDITAADIGWDTPYDWHGYLPAVREARKHGAIIMATPWSPPASYKTNESTTGGEEIGVHGKLKDNSYSKLFTWFNTFLTYMQNNDAPVDVVSIQNEPDWWVGYSGCEYTPDELQTLVKNYASRLNKEKFGVRLMSAEPLGFDPRYYTQLMKDEETAKHIDILGGHIYGAYDRLENLATAASLAAPLGKEVWMTEHSINPPERADGLRDVPTWKEQLEFVEDVNECLVNGANAYVYWYLAKEWSFIADGTKYDTSKCTDPNYVRGEILPRGYLMGQFARHLKGATRLVTTTNLKDGSDTPGVNRRFEMSAFFKGDSIIVNAIDTLDRDFTLQLTLPCEVTSLHRIQSTEEAVCAEEDIDIEPGTKFSLPVPGHSFTTYIFRMADSTALAVSQPKGGRPADTAWYNLQGQRVSQPTRGIFIHRGKKVVIP